MKYALLGRTGVTVSRLCLGNLDEIVIATKVFFPMTDRPNMGGLSRNQIQQSCEDSLRRLGAAGASIEEFYRSATYLQLPGGARYASLLAPLRGVSGFVSKLVNGPIEALRQAGFQVVRR